MQIELILSPSLYEGRQIHDHVTVAVDILRASTAICAAFKAGVDEVVPLDTLDALPEYKGRGYTIAAERNGSKLPGASCGNSPTEYLTMDLHGHRLAYSTTNGTVTILRASDSLQLYVGAFSNITALSSRLALCRKDLVILCSGWRGEPSLEDTLFGGALIEHIMSLRSDIKLVNDAAMLALDLWHVAQPNPAVYCEKATHVHRLKRLNADKDIQFAFLTYTCPVVPVFNKETGSLWKE